MVDTDKVSEVIKAIRPAIQADNGDIYLRDVDEATGVVSVELVGACVSCPASTVTLKAGIERILRDRVEGVTEVVNVGRPHRVGRRHRLTGARRASRRSPPAARPPMPAAGTVPAWPADARAARRRHRAGDRSALARLLSLVERGGDDGPRGRPRHSTARAATPYTVGITGAPGRRASRP